MLIVGLNHNSADISIREKVSFSPEEVREALSQLSKRPFVQEAVLLSTCNRTELLIYSPNPKLAQREAEKFLAEKGECEGEKLKRYLYKKENCEAIRHIFEVASGLDSMVLGEPQVTCQVKNAFELALENGVAGQVFSGLYRYTRQTVKKVRTETGIAKSAVSVSYAAVELARKVFETLAGKKALLVGAGEMCELAAKHFHDHGISSIDVANRTFSRAKKLAGQFGGKPFSFDELYRAMESADIILTSTGATEPVFSKSEVKRVMKKRLHRSLFIIDIAVPRDVEEGVGKISDVYLFDIDDLKHVVEANKKNREREALKALTIIEQQVEEYRKWCRVRGVNDLIIGLRKQAEEIRKTELAKSQKKLKDYPEEVQQEIERMSVRMLNKFLHQPISGLKRALTQDQTENELVPFFKAIFNLENKGNGVCCDRNYQRKDIDVRQPEKPLCRTCAGEEISGKSGNDL